ncbi:MAG: S9 family peptidase [Chloroflexi bacterium]|nr:S9 family peptidase [Chloroflexota bacterium]
MPSPIDPTAIYHLVGVAEPHLSPDGHLLAFVRSQVDREAMTTRSQIMLMSLPGGAARSFTQGTRDAQPRFSPDGRHLAFLRPDAQKRRQIWVMPVDGGEARQLTTAEGDISEFTWSPDGQRLAFVADVDPDRLPEGHDRTKEPQVKVVRRIRYRADTVGWRGDAHRHLFTVGLDGGPARQITAGDGDDVAPAWSPDGTRIAFLSGRRPDRDLRAGTEAYVVPTEGGEPECWSGSLALVDAVAWSPHGDRLVVAGSDDPDAVIGGQAWLFALAPGTAPRRMTDDAVRPATGFRPTVPEPELRWTADGHVLFLADARGQSYLSQVPVAGGPVRTVAGGGFLAAGLSLDAQAAHAVIAAAPPDSPGALYYVEVSGGAVRRLTAYNQEYFAQHPPARLEKFTFQRSGWDIEARLWLPPDFDPQQRFPLVLDIHGGPHGAFYDAFNLTHQILATAGYLVLAVNPRGSATYGEAFTRAVLGDWGGEDYLDLMAAVDLVASRPEVDRARLGVHGYSYGGFMTLWTVGHTDRFRAAVSGAPCTDLASMYGTSDIGVSFGEIQWGGPRAVAFAGYVARSPLSYAAQVQTPVLLLHGEADVRCPIEQSEQYFVALKRLGKDVEFVRFPECSHLFLRAGHPRMREEYYRRVLAWFDRYLKAESVPAAEAAAMPGSP